jgi:hypothetical protein
MKITWMGVLGFGAVAIVVLLALAWLVTRRLLRSSRHRATPISAFSSGWRGIVRLGRAAPFVAVAAFGVKLFQILGKDLQNIFLRRHPMVWSLTGIAIDLIFALAWAVVALRIYFYLLAPDATREQRWARTRIAVVYALIFWAAGILLNFLGIGLVVWVKGADHGVVIEIVAYLSYALTVVAALTRPGIAIGLAKPLRESFRLIRENWFGATITVLMAAVPLGLVFMAVGLAAHVVRMRVYVALLLEFPIAALSALCYFAFEGVIAGMYRRIR